MPDFASHDGLRLSYDVRGEGPPLVCLAGGPGADVRCLGTLGGLDSTRTLILMDARGAGASEVPADRASCAFTAQARDVEALRRHLGVDRIDVLAHSAGTLTAQEYAATHPDRVGALVLVTPAGRVDREVDPEEVAWIRARRAGEDWYAAAVRAEEPGPFAYGTWTAAARRHLAVGYGAPPPWLREAFYTGAARGDAVPARVARLAALRCAVLAIAGDTDGIAGTAPVRLVADTYPDGRLEVLRGCGHWPWVDDAPAFRALVAGFLASA